MPKATVRANVRTLPETSNVIPLFAKPKDHRKACRAVHRRQIAARTFELGRADPAINALKEYREWIRIVTGLEQRMRKEVEALFVSTAPTTITGVGAVIDHLIQSLRDETTAPDHVMTVLETLLSSPIFAD